MPVCHVCWCVTANGYKDGYLNQTNITHVLRHLGTTVTDNAINASIIYKRHNNYLGQWDSPVTKRSVY